MIDYPDVPVSLFGVSEWIAEVRRVASLRNRAIVLFRDPCECGSGVWPCHADATQEAYEVLRDLVRGE